MSNATPSTTVAHRRPRAVTATAGVLTFLGVSAVTGGASMVAGVGAPPRDWLPGIPVIDSWVAPGLVLGIGFGLGSLATAYGLELAFLPSSPCCRPCTAPWASS